MPLPQSAPKMSRTLARDEAYVQLRGWIIDGTLQPGEVLRDQAIAAALGVSRTPVREALRRLEDEGFVETALNRWTRVAPLDLNKAAETYAVIEALEVLALELAFGRLTRDDLQRMSDANRAMQRAAEQQDPASAVRADEGFHDVWIGQANNGELSLLLGQLRTKLRRVELAYFDAAARGRQSFHEHAAIIKALQKRSLPEAAAAVRVNWRGSAQRMRAFVAARSPEIPPSQG
jgi:DNA-binding GntR family transcriptional regulator